MQFANQNNDFVYFLLDYLTPLDNDTIPYCGKVRQLKVYAYAKK